MPAEQINFRAVITAAWAGMLAILLAMLLVDPLRHAMAGTYTELSDTLRHDPGVVGLQVLLVMLALNTLVQVAVHVFSSRRWRGILLGLSVLYTLFFLAHQIVNLLGGEEFGLHTILDVTHHLLGFTACWAAWRWRQFAS